MQTANIYAERARARTHTRTRMHARYYLYIYFLPPVRRPANSAGAWHSPTFKTMRRWRDGGRKKERRNKEKENKAAGRWAGHQMLITGCLSFNRQRHRSVDGERGDSLHECGHSYDRRGRKKNTAQHHLHIYTLAQAQNTLLICRETPVCFAVCRKWRRRCPEKKQKKIYNPPQGNDLCDVGILNEGEDIHNICQIEKKRK